ncbi:MAG TPA: PIN domain-containing protein [Acidimicrobiales bacterium]|nr:PIN domain-containing protein [Acidimicrobiales bacterium]
MARRRSAPHPAPPVAVLDSEALSVLADPIARRTSAKRAQAVLEAIERRGGIARAPAPVLAEVSRTKARSAAIAQVLRHARVVPTDRDIAERAGLLLERLRLDSCHAVDAFVVATAAMLGNAVILTGDPDDMRRLVAHVSAVAVQPLP